MIEPGCQASGLEFCRSDVLDATRAGKRVGRARLGQSTEPTSDFVMSSMSNVAGFVMPSESSRCFLIHM